jgi:hypothetical protein
MVQCGCFQFSKNFQISATNGQEGDTSIITKTGILSSISAEKCSENEANKQVRAGHRTKARQNIIK